jgi:predicted transcriptional regulator
MGGKKQVLNVTVDAEIAETVRLVAKQQHRTVSSVVEEALAKEVEWERIRQEGLRAMEEYHEKYGYPSPEVTARVEAEIDEMLRLQEEAHRINEERRAARRRERQVSDGPHDKGEVA